MKEVVPRGSVPSAGQVSPSNAFLALSSVTFIGGLRLNRSVSRRLRRSCSTQELKFRSKWAPSVGSDRTFGP